MTDVVINHVFINNLFLTFLIDVKDKQEESFGLLLKEKSVLKPSFTVLTG